MMSRYILKAMDTLFNFIVICCLFIMGIYAGFALWDNNRIYVAAENVQIEMAKIKPFRDEEGHFKFDELLAINGDICAWLELDNTRVDYPIVQGDTNLVYINRDIYGEFALAGSIFLDARNDPGFNDVYNLMYGHHMDEGRMFGDLDLYKDETFFLENKTGKLTLPDREYHLEIFACLLVAASDDYICDVDVLKNDLEDVLRYAERNHLYLRSELIEELRGMDHPQVLAMSTCSSEFTDARTVVLAVMRGGVG